jgi:phosphomethylpyrimidine synthase
MTTQLEQAKQGKLTDLVSQAARNENVDAKMLCNELAAGRAVVPANTIHLQHGLKPCAIGRCVSTKINANIGLSAVRSSLEDEIEKMRIALESGADAVMDLSTGGDLDAIRERLLSECPVWYRADLRSYHWPLG